MSRLDDTIADVAYILDSLMALRSIQNSGCCNNCDIQGKLHYCPKPGEMVRYNCPSWMKKGEKHETNRTHG